jgi:hypothetical protein
MSRDIDAAITTALAGQHVPALMLVELDFPSGTLRLNNSGQNIDWNGSTWYAGGALIGISEVAESTDGEAHGVTLQLNAVELTPITGSPNNANIVQLARAQNYQGRAARVWLAPLDADYVPVVDPVLAFEGRMNKMDFQVGEDAAFSLACESRFADWNRPRVRRYNDADQRSRFPSDRGLEYMEQMVEKQLIWKFPVPGSFGSGVNAGSSRGALVTTDRGGAVTIGAMTPQQVQSLNNGRGGVNTFGGNGR